MIKQAVKSYPRAAGYQGGHRPRSGYVSAATLCWARPSKVDGAIGENVDGRRALEIGLIDHVVEADSLTAEVNALVDRYSRLCSEGTRQSKILLNMPFDMPHWPVL